MSFKTKTLKANLHTGNFIKNTPGIKLMVCEIKNNVIIKAVEPQYTNTEERINCMIHGIGALLSVIGSAVLVVCAGIYGDRWHIISFSVFGSTLIILYAVSTLYHGTTNTKAKRVFRIFDHSAIFILIAGTYTPFMLVSLRGVWGWSIFGIVWGCAVLGIILKTLYIGRFTKISVSIYVAMGWLCIVALKEILANISFFSIILLVFGGLAYTLGVIFYAWHKLSFNHAIWHGFVLAGSVFHYFAVLLILQPS